MPKDPAKAAKAKEKKEKKLLEQQMKNSREKVEEGRHILEPPEQPNQRGAPPPIPYQKAIACFDQALEFYSENFEACMYRGHANRELGKMDQAIDDYSRAITLNVQCIPALEGRAACFEAVENWDAVIRDYTSVLELQPNNDHAYNMRGRARLHKRPPGLRLRNAEYASVVDDFSKAVRFNEHNYHAWCNLGRVYADHKKFTEALAAYSKAVALRDDYAYAWYRRGCCALDGIEWEQHLAGLLQSSSSSGGGASSLKLPPIASKTASSPAGGAADRAVTPSQATVASLTTPLDVIPAPAGMLIMPPAPPGAGAGGATTTGGSGRPTPSSGATSTPPMHLALLVAGADEGALEAAASAIAGSVVQNEEQSRKTFAQQLEMISRAISDFTRVIPADDRLQLEPTAVLNRALCYKLRAEIGAVMVADPTAVNGALVSLTTPAAQQQDLDLAKAELTLLSDFLAKQSDDTVLGPQGLNASSASATGSGSSVPVPLLKEMVQLRLARCVQLIAARKAMLKGGRGAGGGAAATAAVGAPVDALSQSGRPK